jgi:hypothetical protein
MSLSNVKDVTAQSAWEHAISGAKEAVAEERTAGKDSEANMGL